MNAQSKVKDLEYNRDEVKESYQSSLTLETDGKEFSLKEGFRGWKSKSKEQLLFHLSSLSVLILSCLIRIHQVPCSPSGLNPLFLNKQLQKPVLNKCLMSK